MAMESLSGARIHTRRNTVNRFKAGLEDLGAGLSHWRVWTAFAWEDIKNTYRRSIIGALWISLSFAIFVGVKLMIFGPMIVGVPAEYFGAYLLLGFFAWQFISQIVTMAPTTFVANENWIKNDPLPYSTYVYQATAKATFNFALTAITGVIFYLYFGQGLGPHAWLAVPAILVFILNAVWVKLLLGVICTRLRDITHLTQTIMRVMFFLTPIFWIPAQMPERLMEFLWWNPFAHFIWILRSPILDNDPVVGSWIFVGVVTVVGWTIALVVFSLFRRRIVFWF